MVAGTRCLFWYRRLECDISEVWGSGRFPEKRVRMKYMRNGENRVDREDIRT